MGKYANKPTLSTDAKAKARKNREWVENTSTGAPRENPSIRKAIAKTRAVTKNKITQDSSATYGG